MGMTCGSGLDFVVRLFAPIDIDVQHYRIRRVAVFLDCSCVNTAPFVREWNISYVHIVGNVASAGGFHVVALIKRRINVLYDPQRLHFCSCT